MTDPVQMTLFDLKPTVVARSATLRALAEEARAGGYLRVARHLTRAAEWSEERERRIQQEDA